MPNIALPVVNADFNQPTIFPGAYASLFGQNLAISPTSVQVTLNDRPVTVQFASSTQVNILIPVNFPVGPAILRLNNGAQNALPVIVQIDPPPPVIIGLLNNSGTPLGTSTVGKGDQVNVVVTGLDPSAAAGAFPLP